MLEYLDINRDKLVELFEEAYDLKSIPKLSKEDNLTAVFVAKSIISYVKAATCLYYKNKTAAEDRSTAATVIAAKMEKAKASKAMAAVQQAITNQTDDIPKDMKTLKDVINRAIDSRNNEKKRPADKPAATPQSKKKRIPPKDKAAEKTPTVSKPKGQGQAAKPKANPGTDKKTNQQKQPKQGATTQQKQPKPDRCRSKTKKTNNTTK